MKFREIACTALFAVFLTGIQCPDQPIRVLFLSKSSGFEHPVIRTVDGQPSVVESVLSDIAIDLGATLTSTKDASQINAENLRNFDVVIFFTSGDLTQPGTDGQTPMSEQGLGDLLEWIRRGGGFIGLHSASDTFHSESSESVSDYIEMLGGEFRQHGTQFEGRLLLADPDHPTMADLPEEWILTEEWYLFTNVKTDAIHPLLVFDPGAEGDTQPIYDVDPYPIAWWRCYGLGRVYYTGLAHNADTWQQPSMHTMVQNAIEWSARRSAPR